MESNDKSEENFEHSKELEIDFFFFLLFLLVKFHQNENFNNEVIFSV
jgi:hypothetical protein